MKKLFLLALGFCALFSGCAKQIVYKEVKIPIRCDIERPMRPSARLESLEYLRSLLVYVETLENDLKFCTKTNP
ncbi:hypothetical protein [Helicobacter acinonychis]|uniref:DNA methyltransferase n=1 Tax=Helicobacter acinonychis (strain Sheeba) TaxID=382638 RepID=Q17VI9_HELAH|nr:hypothetical protein [Helicobacter acinonychis]CAK00337.1 hypothetical protein Hac_1629 [Helicobacter acinonychis str. Sheeba]